jgi:hypothetical protein
MWKTITTHPNYEVSDAGEVRNCKTGRVLKGILNQAGYLQIILCPGHNQYKIHRLVAMYHLENPENKPQIDHIDRNRSNNSIQNLRWATRSENQLNKDYYTRKKDGLHNILVTPNGTFSVQIRGYAKVNKSFKTLEDAIAFRDRFMAENPR